MIFVVCALPYMLPFASTITTNIKNRVSLGRALGEAKAGDKVIYVSSTENTFEALKAARRKGKDVEVYVFKSGETDVLVAALFAGNKYGKLGDLPRNAKVLEDFLDGWEPDEQEFTATESFVAKPKQPMTGATQVMLSRESESLLERYRSVEGISDSLNTLVDDLFAEQKKHNQEIAELRAESKKAVHLIHERPDSSAVPGNYPSIPYKEQRHTLLVKNFGAGPILHLASFFIAFRQWMQDRGLKVKLIIFYDGTIFKTQKYKKIAGLQGTQVSATAENIKNPRVYNAPIITTQDGQYDVMHGMLADADTDLLIVLDLNGTTPNHIFSPRPEAMNTSLVWAVGSSTDAKYLMSEMEPKVYAEDIISSACPVDNALLEIPWLQDMPSINNRLRSLVNRLEPQFESLTKFARTSE